MRFVAVRPVHPAVGVTDMKRLRLAACIVLPFLLLACGGEDGGSSTPAPAPAPTATATPAPTPTPTAAPTPANDGLVQDALVPSLDSSRYLKRTYQGVATIARVGKRIWTAWFADTSPAAWEVTGNFLVLTYSDDGGNTWSREYYLVPAHPDTDRACDPRLWPAPDGKLWVIYCQGGGKVNNDGQFGIWATVISDPLADNPTFEPGFWMTDGVPARPFLYRNQWYLPSDYLYANPPRFPDRIGKRVYLMDWANHRATYVTKIPKTPNADYNETTFVELKDGSLLNQSRSRDGIYQSIAPAGTLDFPTPSRWLFYPSIGSRHQISRSPSGRLLMVFNQHETAAGRTDLTIAFSDDEGKSWPNAYIFDNRDNISYPDVAFAENGDILVSYDRGRNSYKEIWLARIVESSIVDGKGAPKVTLKLVNRATKP